MFGNSKSQNVKFKLEAWSYVSSKFCTNFGPNPIPKRGISFPNILLFCQGFREKVRITRIGLVFVLQQGNRSSSSACGSADVLEALGVVIDLEPEVSSS